MTNVKLGVRNLDAKGSKAAESCRHLAAARCRANDQMSLEANAVDWSTCALDNLDDLHCSVSLSTIVFKVVIVVVAASIRLLQLFLSPFQQLRLQLCLRISSPGSFEGYWKVIRAKHPVKDTVTPGATIICSLVDDIP